MRTLVAAATALALLGTGCGPGPTIEDYGSQLETRVTAYAAEHDDLAAQHLSGLERAIAELERTQEGEALAAAAVGVTAQRSAALIAAVGDALDRLQAGLTEIEAPGPVVDAHRAFIDAIGRASEGTGPLVDRLANATSFDEMDRMLSGSAYADAGPRLHAACERLQEAIADQGVTVDLRCGSVR